MDILRYDPNNVEMGEQEGSVPADLFIVVPLTGTLAVTNALNNIQPGLGDDVTWSLNLASSALGPATNVGGTVQVAVNLLNTVRLALFEIVNCIFSIVYAGIVIATNVVGFAYGTLFTWGAMLGLMGLVEL